MDNILTSAQLYNIKRLCNKYHIVKYETNNDGSIDVTGSVDILTKTITELPLKFNKVTGYFDCSSNQLTTLEGCPKDLLHGFYCNNNKLSTLQGCPYLNSTYSFTENNFPAVVMNELLNVEDNNETINIFVKYQDHFDVWEDGFNYVNYFDLMNEIREGLR